MKAIQYPYRLIVPVVLMLSLALGARAIADNGGPVTVGVLENSAYAYTVMMRKSFALAQEAINAEGGINGRFLRLVYANDDGCKETGIQAVKSLVGKHKVVLLTGGYSSSNTLAMTRKADDLNTPFLVCTAADDRITRHRRENVFRISPPASEYTRALERLLQEKLMPETMAIVYENSPFGTSGAGRMMRFCRENDIRITAIIPYHKERATAGYFDRILARLKDQPPEAIYLVSYYRDGVLMVRRIRAAGIRSHLLGGAGGFTHPQFIENTGDSSNYMLTATLWSADLQRPLARQYVHRYFERYKETPDYHGAEAYSALIVAADALRRAASLNAADIRRALNRTAIETPFGPVAFKSYGDYDRQNRPSTMVLQAMEGRLKCVWPEAAAVASMVIPKAGIGGYRRLARTRK